MNYQIAPGAFEAHDDEMMIELWKEVQPFYSRQKPTDYEIRMFQAVCDFLKENEENWIWNIIDKRDNPMLETIDVIKRISRELIDIAFTSTKYKYNTRGELIERIIKKINKDKFEYPKWITEKTYKTPNGIKVRYSTKNEIALKGLYTKGLIMSLKDYEAFSKEVEMDLDNISPDQIERLISDYETDKMLPIWKKYKTIRTFYESLLTELGKDDKLVIHSNRKYKVGRGYYTEKVVYGLELDNAFSQDVFDENLNNDKEYWKKQSGTIDALDLF